MLPQPIYQEIGIIKNHIEFDVAFIGEGELLAMQFAKT